jgi:hypothetical protein
MSVLKSMPYHHAVRRVSRWCAWYTRGLDAQVAGRRRDEIASDLYEHGVWADNSGESPRATARDILGRAVRGIPADLGWRHAQRRQLALADPVGFRMRQANGVVVTLVLLLAAAITGFGFYVLTRVAASVLAGYIRPASATALMLIALTALALGGLALLAYPRTRFVGALVMIAPGIGLIHLGLYQLYSLSTTVGVLMFGMPGWNLASRGLILGVTVCFVAAAIWWWPENRRAHQEPLPHISPLEAQRNDY